MQPPEAAVPSNKKEQPPSSSPAEGLEQLQKKNAEGSLGNTGQKSSDEGAPRRDVCVWTADYGDKGGDVYDTRCGRNFNVVEGTPEMSGILFCPYCGGRIHVDPDLPCMDCGKLQHEHPVTDGDTLCKDYQP